MCERFSWSVFMKSEHAEKVIGDMEHMKGSYCHPCVYIKCM